MPERRHDGFEYPKLLDRADQPLLPTTMERPPSPTSPRPRCRRRVTRWRSNTEGRSLSLCDKVQLPFGVLRVCNAARDRGLAEKAPMPGQIVSRVAKVGPVHLRSMPVGEP